MEFKVKLTELEKKLTDSIRKTWGETGLDSAYLDDSCKDAGITMKEGRGVISSLIKKGVVLECLAEFGYEINLTTEGAEFLNIDTNY